MNPSLDLALKYQQLIANILAKHLPSNAKICFFGSRTTGQAKPFSDIDILIDIGKPLSLKQLTTLNIAFDESLLPYKVDIADATVISESFKQAIFSQLIPFALDL